MGITTRSDLEVCLYIPGSFGNLRPRTDEIPLTILADLSKLINPNFHGNTSCYGNIAPKTDVGKIVTIFYALLGIPLMLLCLTNIGDLLARSFKFTYFHLCFLFRKPRRTHASSQKQVIEHIKTPVGKAVEVATLELCNGDEKSSLGEKKIPLGDDSSTLSSSPTKSNNASMIVVPDPTPVIIERVYRNSSGAEDQRVPMYMVLLLVTGYICGGAVLLTVGEMDISERGLLLLHHA
ncbi:uncharacterized protein CEXT_760501 [Caerostris extrusa]|uniref:Potassium channel domain-containing protein n=1 Tax=Caerostris extrusa TaxID=172846 RepID=A0AAV4Q417_CAEEX|nr:uncharacterized protein CEXT_760501 [Caerostris extrusa]